LYSIPTIGRYASEYKLAAIQLLIKKDGNFLNDHRHIPMEIKNLEFSSEKKITFYFMCNDMTHIFSPKSRGEPILNMLYYGWTFLNAEKDTAIFKKVLMCVSTTNSKGISKPFTGPKTYDSIIDVFKNQSVALHAQMNSALLSCSPNNAHFKCNPKLSVNDFWAIAVNGDECVISYHWLINGVNLARDINEKLPKIASVDDLRSAFSEFNQITPSMKATFGSIFE
jgi:hypothetical protein